MLRRGESGQAPRAQRAGRKSSGRRHRRRLRLRRWSGEDRRIPHAHARGRLGRGDRQGATPSTIPALPPPPSPSHRDERRSKEQTTPSSGLILPGIEPARENQLRTANDHWSGAGLGCTDMPDAHVRGPQAFPQCQTKTHNTRMRGRELISPQNHRRAGVPAALQRRCRTRRDGERDVLHRGQYPRHVHITVDNAGPPDDSQKLPDAAMRGRSHILPMPTARTAAPAPRPPPIRTNR